MRVIAFCGPSGSGKDTAAKYLFARNSLTKTSHSLPLFEHIPFADPIKQVCRIMFGLTNEECTDAVLKDRELTRWPYLEPRKIIRDEANHLRDVYGYDIHARAWDRTVGHSIAMCAVVTDLRFPNEELPAIRARGGKVVYIRNAKVEEERLRGIEAGDEKWLNVSESYYPILLKEADAIIDNNDSIAQLHEAVGIVTKNLLGDWEKWEAHQ
jgi:energy-coupling factor transporter ATP-binding protein EcfA2